MNSTSLYLFPLLLQVLRQWHDKINVKHSIRKYVISERIRILSLPQCPSISPEHLELVGLLLVFSAFEAAMPETTLFLFLVPWKAQHVNGPLATHYLYDISNKYGRLIILWVCSPCLTACRLTPRLDICRTVPLHWSPGNRLLWPPPYHCLYCKQRRHIQQGAVSLRSTFRSYNST